MNVVAMTRVAIVAALIAWAGSPVARAAEVKLISVAALTGVVNAIGGPFERDTGHKLVTKYFSGPTAHRAIKEGEAFDLILSSTPTIDALVKEGRIVSRTDIASVGMAVGVRAGAPKPDISTADALRKALLGAKAVAFSAEGVTGTYFRGLLKKLGIAEEMAPKLRPMPAAKIMKAVPSGEADMVVITMSVIVEGAAELVGLLPAELQFYNHYAAGIASNAAQADAARALLGRFTGPGAADVIKKAGLQAAAK